MVTHTWTNRIVPLLVFLGIISCVWYAAASRPKTSVALPVPFHVDAAPAASATANRQPIADVAPTIDKHGDRLCFSINTTSFKRIQKVEFYVENKLVGAAYSQPYSVTVPEDNLSAGTHSVTAKVYTSDATAQTTPALFTANPQNTSSTPLEDDQTTPPTTAVAATSPPAVSVLVSPAGLSISADSSGTSAQLTWAAVPQAAGYQVWQDGALLGTVTSTSYTDTGLSPGQTYDYYLISVGAGGSASDASDQVGVTMPMPQQNITVPPKPPDDPQSHTNSLTPDTNRPSDTSASSQSQ